MSDASQDFQLLSPFLSTRIQTAMITTTTSTGAQNASVPVKLRAGTSKANRKLQPEAAKEAPPQQQDFFRTYTEEPHRTRRMAIIKAHPEVSLLEASWSVCKG